MIGTEAIAAIIGGVAVAAFAGGFFIADWKADGEIEKLRGDNKLLSATNNQCATDISNVRTAMETFEANTVERERQAREAMKQAEPIIERRKATITRIRALPAVRPDAQCEAIEHEQIAYVASRQDETR